MRKINAVYDKNKIRVYQAYNDSIANEALELGTFGERFKKTRMTWIKPSFLWMMYRAGWAEKDGQERILGIDISIEGFLEILKNAVLASFDEKVYENKTDWEKEKLKYSGRCQWDPERDIFGNPKEYRAIQLGIKEELVEKYLENWIINIEDLTPKVKEMKLLRDQGKDISKHIPKEKEFIISDKEIINRLGIDN